MEMATEYNKVFKESSVRLSLFLIFEFLSVT